jgi:hypothetical protein
VARADRSHRESSGTPIGWFVAEIALDLGLDESPSALRTRRVVRRLVEWASREGMALERELIFDPDTVERFVDRGLAGERSRATYRAVLRRVAPRLTRHAAWEPRPAAVAWRQVAPPYGAAEVRILQRDAALQSTAPRRRSARALLALGLGAGLDGRWVARVSAEDVEGVGGVVFVRVAEPSARRVVVLAQWEREVLELAATAGDEFLVGGRSQSPRRTGHLVEQLHVPTGHPRLAPARLRSTWLVCHLAAGTRLPELCRAAGLRGATVLSDLLAEVAPLDEATAISMLRRGRR